MACAIMFKPPTKEDRLVAIGIDESRTSSRLQVQSKNTTSKRYQPKCSNAESSTGNKGPNLSQFGAKSSTDGPPKYLVRHRDVYHRDKIRVTPELIKAIEPDPVRFLPIPVPKSGEWLAEHEESGQTFLEFVTNSRFRRPDSTRNKIYIVPLSFFENAVPGDVLNRLVEFASIFFDMKVKVRRIPTIEVDHRENPCSRQVQVNAGQILAELVSTITRDAFCTSAITLCDLYPRDEWNYVFGLANLNRGTGVYSLARYLPNFGYGSPAFPSGSLSSSEMSQLLKRSCLLMCHEICHMFGMKHCIYFHCLMNGSNHFEENDSKPLHLCPVCLRKLHFSCGFDVKTRYSKLAEFCKKSAMTNEQHWFEQSYGALT